MLSRISSPVGRTWIPVEIWIPVETWSAFGVAGHALVSLSNLERISKIFSRLEVQRTVLIFFACK